MNSWLTCEDEILESVFKFPQHAEISREYRKKVSDERLSDDVISSHRDLVSSSLPRSMGKHSGRTSGNFLALLWRGEDGTEVQRAEFILNLEATRIRNYTNTSPSVDSATNIETKFFLQILPSSSNPDSPGICS